MKKKHDMRVLQLLAAILLFVSPLACTSSSLVPPEIISAKFGAGVDAQAPKELKVIHYNEFGATELDATLPKDPTSSVYSDVPVVSMDPTKGAFLLLGFSVLLSGSSIETLNCDTREDAQGNVVCRRVGEEQYKQKIPVITGFKTNEGIIEIRNVSDGTIIDPKNYVVSYRPEGGYTPLPSEPVYNMPPPAIRIDLAKDKLPAGAVLQVNLLVDTEKPIKNADGVAIEPARFMKGETETEGQTVKNAAGKLIAATVLFKTAGP